MSIDRPYREIVLDERRRTSLAKVGHKEHRRYLAEERPDGTLVLYPAVTVTTAEMAVLRNPKLREALKKARKTDPSLLQRWDIPPKGGG